MANVDGEYYMVHYGDGCGMGVWRDISVLAEAGRPYEGPQGAAARDARAEDRIFVPWGGRRLQANIWQCD